MNTGGIGNAPYLPHTKSAYRTGGKDAGSFLEKEFPVLSRFIRYGLIEYVPQ